MGWKLPEITRCCFCIPLRYGLVTWGYITLTINFSFFCDDIVRINKLLNEDDNVNRVLYKSGELLLLIADMVLVTVLIVAAHKKNVKWLRISLIGNLTSVILYTLYSIYMVMYYSLLLRILSELLSNTASFEKTMWFLAGIAAAVTIEILLKFYIMFLLRKEIKKLDSNKSEFRFVNKVTDEKSKMECVMEMENGIFKQTKTQDEVNGEEDKFDKHTEETGAVIEASLITEIGDCFKYMNETTCEMEYEGVTK